MPPAIESHARSGPAMDRGSPAQDPFEGSGTLARGHLSAMREHDRKAALLHWEGGRWVDTPDWRLDRQVIRLGLHLRERMELSPGERVAILSPLRREWLLADLSASVQGAAAVAIDPDLPAPALAAALARIAPRIAFVSGPAELERLEEARRALPVLAPVEVIAFDGPPPGERAILLSEALDLGGTLDTAERAVAFRAQAREVSPDACAIGHAGLAPDGSPSCSFQSHREVTAQLAHLRLRAPARPGDLAYLAGAVTPALRLALLAFAGDGVTTTAFGTPGREAAEIAALRPHKIVAPASVLLAAAAQARRGGGEPGVRGWIARAAGLLSRSCDEASRRRRAPAALGGRARWVRPADAPGDGLAGLAGRLGGTVAADLDA